MRLLDRVAVITGGASGIGRAIADRFVEEGARVVIADLSAEAGARAADEINGAGSRGSAAHYAVDVSARDQVRHFATAVQERFGHIDVLINNAGVTRYRPFLEAASEDWNAVLDVDLKGVFSALRRLRRRWSVSPTGRSSISHPFPVPGVPPMPRVVRREATPPTRRPRPE